MRTCERFYRLKINNATEKGTVAGGLSVGTGTIAGMSFQGWPEAAFDVLVDLEGDPSPAQLETHRDELEQHVRAPLQLLCDALNDKHEFGTFWLSNLTNRPVMWQRQHATAWIARRVRITLTFDLDGLVLGGGSANATGDQVPLFRKMVDADGSGKELAAIVKKLERNRFELAGSTLLRVPREYPKDHPRADLLKRRSVYAEKPLDPDNLAEIRKAVRLVHGLTTWCTDYVSTAGWHRP